MRFCHIARQPYQHQWLPEVASQLCYPPFMLNDLRSKFDAVLPVQQVTLWI